MSEKASGEADSCTDNSDKELSECPTCGDIFNSTAGMKRHHASAHGESIAGVSVECCQCSKSFRVTPSKVENQTNLFCSKECSGKYRSEHYTGKNNPQYIDDKPTFECEYCGDVNEAKPSEVDEKRFCSMACKADWQSEELNGKNSPTWKGGKVKRDCKICGVTVKRKPSHLEKQENVFCSYSCHREYQSIHQTGENHHNFEGGRTLEYGPNWNTKRRAALERDNKTCQDCGKHNCELNRTIHVHHIKPRKDFIENGVLEHETANKLDNLITLCPSCHRKWEGLYLNPDIR